LKKNHFIFKCVFKYY